MYHVKNSHEAIIDSQIFDIVQEEIEKRKKYGYISTGSFLSNKLVCADCGGFYGSKVWGSNTKYKKTVWQCNNKYQTKNKCKTSHVSEEEITESFIKVVNKLISNKEEIIKKCVEDIEDFSDISKLEDKAKKLKAESDNIFESAQEIIKESAKSNDSRDYDKRFSDLTIKFDETKYKIKEIEESIRKRKTTASKIKYMLDILLEQKKIITEFDKQMWFVLLEKVVIDKDKNLIFVFKNGQQIID